jgi:hypothetical protein
MKRSALILSLVAIAGFVFGIVQLFNLRFEAGDVYPKYSSFRADPLGSKALYESLESLLPTSRHVERWSRLPDGRGTTLLYLGADPDELKFPRHQWQSLETFVSSGGRLVISLVTQYKKRGTPPTAQPEEKLIEAGQRWGFEVKHARLPKEDERYQHATARRRENDPSLPAELVWHNAIYFDDPGPEWKSVYVISNDLPVLIERDFGGGQIILCSDPYPFSNEALLAERQVGLLSWLIGPSHYIIFDETHLGVREEPGLATLLRRYRLHGLTVALLFLALLLIWKNADRFIPPIDTQSNARAAAVAGRSSAFGFVNLLRRNIARNELIGVCIDQWKRSNAKRVSRQRLERIQSVIDAENKLPAGQRDPVRIYRSISEILSSRSIS